MKIRTILIGLSLALLAGCATSSGGKSGGVFPCVWSEDGFALYPLYYQSASDRGRSETYWMACGLLGWTTRGGHLATDWLVPLYARGRDWFSSLPFTTVDFGRHSRLELYAAGLGGLRIGENRKVDSHWCLPFYWKSPELFLLALYGRTPEADWTFPLYYRDESWFANPLYVTREADATGDRQLGLPLLLTWAKWDAKGMSTLYSLPFGWTGGGSSQTNAWWATPLVGTHAGARTGAWLFPAFDFSVDARFDEKAAALQAEMVPTNVVFEAGTLTDSRGREARRTVQRGTSESSDERTYLFLFDDDRRIVESYAAASRRYSCAVERKFGNRLLFNYESKREMTFDVRDRWKVSDTEADGFLHVSFLWRLFRYERAPSGATCLDLFYVPVGR